MKLKSKLGEIEKMHKQRLKMGELEACEARQTDRQADPQALHEAGAMVPWLRSEIAKLGMEIHTGEAQAQALSAALLKLEGMEIKSKDLALAITYLETAMWRLRKHLGNAER